jgi:hypothetical protein
MSGSVSRRGLLAGGAAFALAGLAFDADAAAAAPDPLAGAMSEVQVLARLVTIEQSVAFAYRHVLGSVHLSAGTAGALKRFLGHELEHVRVLSSELSRRGGKVPAPPHSVAAVDAVLASLAVSGKLEQVRREWEAIPFLIPVETAEEQSFHAAILRFHSSALALLAARSVTCDAQHWTVLSELAHAGDVDRAVPRAFVPLAAELRS